MSDVRSKILKLQADAQAAFRKAQDAGDQDAMQRLEQIFEKLLQAEDELLLFEMRAAAAIVANLAVELKRATQEINETVDGGFLGDLLNSGRELEQLSGEMHNEIRHESAHERGVPETGAPDTSTAETTRSETERGEPTLPPGTQDEYTAAFASMSIRAAWKDDVDAIVDTFFSDAKNRQYRAVEEATGVPWWAVAILHSLEASQNFGMHLHNGDPLSAPTVRVPKNRPPNFRPGMSWAESAIDAITMDGQRLHQIQDWSVGNALGVFERYNGLGYRKRSLMSPYLWSGSNLYEKGKFIADGVFDPEAVSKQVGAAVLLRGLKDREQISISNTRHVVTPRAPAILGSNAVADLDLSPFEHATEELRFPVNANATIKNGAGGMAAKRVQEWCCLHNRSTGIDSDFGDSTKRSVELFQRDNNLPVTGEVDRDTWLLLTAPMRRALAAIAPMGSLYATYLKVAAQHIRQRPKEVGGNNHGPWVRLYMKGKDGASQKWCAGFVCTLLAQACRDMDIAMPFKRRVGVDELVDDAKDDGRFISESAVSNRRLRSSRIMPGSLFVIRKSTTDWTHVGIVAGVEETLFSTMEGNTNGSNNDGGNAKNSTRNYSKKDFLTLT